MKSDKTTTMTQRIRAMDQLEAGTGVLVHNKFGRVVSCEVKQGHPAGMIAVHRIRYTLIDRGLSGWSNRSRWQPMIKPITQSCNYSFICTTTEQIDK